MIVDGEMFDRVGRSFAALNSICGSVLRIAADRPPARVDCRDIRVGVEDARELDDPERQQDEQRHNDRKLDEYRYLLGAPARPLPSPTFGTTTSTQAGQVGNRTWLMAGRQSGR